MTFLLLLFFILKCCFGFQMLSGTIFGMSSYKIFFEYEGVIGSLDSYSVQVLTKAQTSNAYVSLKNMTYRISQKASIEFQLWNIEYYALYFAIDFVNINNTIQTLEFNDTDLIHLAAFIQITLIQEEIDSFHFISIILQNDLSSIMLPFNLISPKLSKVYITIINQNLTQTTYKNQPFLSTYWNQFGYSVTALPWLPFFSQCSIQANRIMTGELLYPKQCNVLYPFSVQILSCHQKIVNYDCLLQQQNVANPKNYAWYNTYIQPLFYLYPNMVENNQLKQYIDNNLKISQLINEVDSLIPMRLVNNVGINHTPNQILLNFGIQLDSTKNIQIIYATLTLNLINKNFTIQPSKFNNQASVTIIIDYLNAFDGFYYLASSSQAYLLFIPISIFLVIIIRQLFKCASIQLKLHQKVFVCVNKIFKGFLLFFLTNMTFIFGFYYITSITYFSGISTTFNSSADGTTQIYSGRNGLIILICGIYLLSSGINQAFKIDSENQIKIYVQDQFQKKQDFQKNRNSLQFQQILHQKQIFIRQNLNSKRKYLLISLLLVSTALSLLQYQILKFEYKSVAIILLVFHPFFQKLCWSLLKFYCLQELIYSFVILIAFETSAIFYLMLATSLKQLLILYCALITGSLVVHFALQLCFQQIAVKLKYSYSQNKLKVIMYQIFKDLIDTLCSESVYERSLSYSALLHSKMVGLYLQPLFFLLIYCTINQNKIYKTLFVNKTTICNIAIISFSIFLFHLFLIFLVQVILQKKFQMKITETIKLGSFRFAKRSIRWMNDIFNQNSSVYFFYRQFEKFNFSSQLYLASCMMAFSICTISLSIKMIAQTQYIAFVDPVLMFFLFLVWMSGDIMSFIISFLVLKLKLYENKQKNQSRSKLKSLQTILKNQAYFKYLQLDRVKDFFMFTNKQWIINKIQQLLQKQDKRESSQFLKKYNFYKSYHKKYQVQKRRVPRKSLIENQMLIKRLNSAKFSANIFKIQKKLFQENVKPLIYKWFYAARQNCYLKEIVQSLKKENLQGYCEFCQIDIDLQVIQQVDLMQLVNKYRVINVQKFFVPQIFLQFYRQEQTYNTVCLQCKQKNVYLQKSQLKNWTTSKKIILKWLITSRSKILHKRPIVNQNLNSLRQK